MAVQLPTLIVVTGRPGSGKSTLAHQLSRAVRCPLVSRDEIKEGLVNTVGEAEGRADGSTLAVYRAFFDTIRFLLERRITLVAEAAFQHKRWEAELANLASIARVRIVICQTDPHLARSRDLDRGQTDPDRLRFHDDPAVIAAREGKSLPIGDYDPPHLDVPTMNVDTSSGYSPGLDAIVRFAAGG